MQDSSCFLDFTSGKIVTGSGSVAPPSDHHHDCLLETQNDPYRHLNEFPADNIDVLTYIDNVLMEEDDDTTHALQASSEFQDKERSFYELLGHKYPPSPTPQQESTTSELTASQFATLNFWKGVDEATKFLPSNNTLCFTEGSDGPSCKSSRGHTKVVDDKGKKSHGIVDEFDTWTRTDEVFEAHITDLRYAAVRQNSSSVQPIKKSAEVKEAADVRSILILCSQIVASDDHRSANELLKQIKTYSSLNGNMNQTVAFYFVLGLEARLAGTRGGLTRNNNAYTMSPSDYLLAYCTSFVSTSFTKIMIFASSKLIAEKSKKSARVHVVDFGILYGLQWPAFIQRLAEREGGQPTKLRITGIDCEPTTERIATTGSRLAHYAKMFGVPFEYNSIVKSWESITLEDLKIEEGEFLAVNCLLRAEILQDEMIDGAESPREMVVELIRKMNPDVFVHGVVSAGYGSPYFVSRFRESLFHFSSLFDMLDVLIPRERPEWMLQQRILGSEIVNVISCEGPERVSRPETHKQWQIRHTRAGFKQLNFGRKLVGAIHKMRNSYHKDFGTSEDHKWLLMSWKGRTICAVSCWQPVSKFGIDRSATIRFSDQ